MQVITVLCSYILGFSCARLDLASWQRKEVWYVVICFWLTVKSCSYNTWGCFCSEWALQCHALGCPVKGTYWDILPVIAPRSMLNAVLGPMIIPWPIYPMLGLSSHPQALRIGRPIQVKIGKLFKGCQRLAAKEYIPDKRKTVSKIRQDFEKSVNSVWPPALQNVTRGGSLLKLRSDLKTHHDLVSWQQNTNPANRFIATFDMIKINYQVTWSGLLSELRWNNVL